MRISGITLPDKKKIFMGLTVIYGIGRSRADEILSKAGVNREKLSGDLSEDEENKIRTIIEEYKIEGDLKRLVSSNIKRLKDIKAHRGNRHAKHLPVRGQRTKTNSRTVRGNVRKTMASGRRTTEKT